MSSQSSIAHSSVGETLGALYVGATISAVYVPFFTRMNILVFSRLAVYLA